MCKHLINYKTICNNLVITGLAIIISVFVLDWTLKILKFPVTIPPRISHTPNMAKSINNIEYNYTFRTNSEGLRYTEVPLLPTPGSYRVFVSGDSFVEGQSINEEYRFTELLEKMCSNIDQTVFFINGGLSGTAPLEYGRLFLKVGLRYNPNALLICIYANDLGLTPETITENEIDSAIPARSGIKKIAYGLWPRLFIVLKKYKIQREYLKRTQTTDFVKLITKEAIYRKIQKERIEEWKKALPTELIEAINRGEFNGSPLSTGLLYPESWIDSLDISSERAENKLRSMKEILLEIVNRAKQNNVVVAIIYIPTYFQYNPHSHEKKNPWVLSGSQIRNEWLTEKAEIQKRLELFSEELKIPFLDLTFSFREAIKSGVKTNWELDEHWTPAGHKVAALAISKWLSEKRVFSELSCFKNRN